MYRPLITFVLLAYRQEQFVRAAVNAAFAQTYSPLELLLSDDCSQDRTFAIMQEMAASYRGSHKIIIRRNDTNLGLAEHFNRIVEAAAGEIIVCADGDDISMPERTELSWRVFNEYPGAMCVSLGAQEIDSNGSMTRLRPKLQNTITSYSIADYLSDKGFHLHGASRAFKKSVMTAFGPFQSSSQTEDSTTLFRCLLLGRVYDSKQLGIYYRIHADSLSAPNNLHRIKHLAIYKQQNRDLRFALHQGFISADLAARVAIRLRLGFQRRLLNIKCYQSEFSVRSVMAIMMSDTHTIREKVFVCGLALRHSVMKPLLLFICT